MRTSPLVEPFADRLLAADVPALPADRRREVVAFVGRRVDVLPSVIRLGVTVIAALYRIVLVLPGGWWLARRVVERPLPILGEYPRLVRSLGYAYIWERWPDTPAVAA
ncbi:MAG: hypothetical protein QM733_15955 [Ilumatobacteraceae bacterium]